MKYLPKRKLVETQEINEKQLQKMNTVIISSDMASKLEDHPESSDADESTSARYEPFDPRTDDEKIADAIKSEAFLNSVFHPDYKLRKTLEREEQKVREEYDKVVEKLAKGTMTFISLFQSMII